MPSFCARPVADNAIGFARVKRRRSEERKTETPKINRNRNEVKGSFRVTRLFDYFFGDPVLLTSTGLMKKVTELSIMKSIVLTRKTCLFADAPKPKRPTTGKAEKVTDLSVMTSCFTQRRKEKVKILEISSRDQRSSRSKLFYQPTIFLFCP